MSDFRRQLPHKDQDEVVAALVPPVPAYPATRLEVEAIPWTPRVKDDTPPRRRFSRALFWRFRWLALAVFLLLGIPLITWTWLANPPLYQAKAAIEVKPMIPRVVYNTESSGLIPLYHQYLNDQSGVVRSPTVLGRVLDAPDVQQTTWYREAPQPLFRDPPSVLERLRAEVQANVRPRTSFVDVSLATRDPKESALIVNTIVDEYIKYISEQAQKIDDEVYQVIVQEYETLRQTIDGHRSVIAELSRDLSTASPTELQTQQRQRLDLHQAELENVRQQIAITEWRIARLRELLPAGEAAQAEGPERLDDLEKTYALDPEWRRMYLEMLEAEQNVLTQSEHYGESHFRMQELRATAAHKRRLLDIRQNQLELLRRSDPAQLRAIGGTTPENDIRHQEMQLAELRLREQLQTDAIEQERRALGQTSRVALVMAKELEDLQYAERRFDDLRQRKNAMDIERRAPGSIRIQDRAFPPTEPYNTNRRLLLAALALFGSAGIGVGAAYLRATTNPAVQQVTDLTASVQAPFLGRVPLLSGPRGADSVLAVQAECMRMIRTALLQRIVDAKTCAIQITSAGAGAGKTTVAMMLADSLARCGKRVLLVDADLRRPAIDRRFDIPLEPGLVGLLTGKATEAEAVHATRDPRLHVLPAGRLTHADPELLSNGAFGELLARWREQFDLVICDSAPLLPVADARILSRQLDGNVVVTREGHCRRDDVLDALAQLSAAGGTLLGLVLFTRGRPAYYYDGVYSGQNGASEVEVQV